MDPVKQIEIQDSSFSITSTISSMQVLGSNSLGSNAEFIMSAQSSCNNNNVRKTCSEIDIIDMEDETQIVRKDHPLPIYLKFVGVEYKARINETSSKNAVKVLVSKVGSKMNGLERDGDNFKQILKGITGSICPGEILALMGPSGSGKTTLLKIIGGRLRENVKGSITYNDIPYNPALKRRIGFVTQDDVLFPQLTVEETLVFSAFLRLSGNMSSCQKYEKVDMIIKELGLERCRHTQIGGGFLRGLSGGERKRTSIAYEILVDPSLLLLDEPTSGLDSSSANKLLQILQGVAKAGRTIITTIHQPSSRIFHTFNKVLLISEGSPIYNGEARQAMEYFSSLQFIPEIAMNPAEFLLDLATGQVKDISIPQVLAAAQGITPEYERVVIRYLQEKFKVQLDPIGERNAIYFQMSMAPEHLQSAIQIKKDWTSSWLDQFIILSKRTFRMRYREYFDVLRLIQALGVAILLGLLWWKSNARTEAQLRDQVGLMFYICIFWTYTSIFEAIFVFPSEKLYLVKERKADMYRLSVYYVCSSMCDMAARVLNPTLFTSILYFMAGLKRTPQCFFLTLVAVFLIAITSHGAGELSGAAVMNIKRTGTLASSVLMLFLLTGGYYVQHMPMFMKWLKYVSFMHYGYKLLLKVQYSGDELYDCESDRGCRKLQNSPTFDTVNLNGGLEEVWILLAMAVGYRICAYICLRQNINGFHL